MRKRKNKKPQFVIELPPSSKEPEKKRKVLAFLTSAYGILSVIAVVTGVVLSVEPIRNMFLTESEKFEKEKIVKGELKPDEIPTSYSTANDEYNGRKIRQQNFTPTKTTPIIEGILIDSIKGIDTFLIWFDNDTVNKPYNLDGLKRPKHVRGTGPLSVPADQLFDGVNPAGEIGYLGYDKSPFFPYILKVIGNRLYISTTFKDINKEEIIGIIHYNEWKLYRDNMLEFRNDDKRLEVMDKAGNIVFSVKFVAPNRIIVLGYFIGNHSAMVFSDAIKIINFENDKNWKKNCLEEIRKIKSIYD